MPMLFLTIKHVHLNLNGPCICPTFFHIRIYIEIKLSSKEREREGEDEINILAHGSFLGWRARNMSLSVPVFPSRASSMKEAAVSKSR